MGHLDAHNILSDVQHGFRKNRSCESQLITTCSDFINAIEQNLQVDAILLDFSKAFDKVHHRSLLSKLDHLGIRGNTLDWMRSFLNDRRQRVLVEGKASTSEPVLSGVPQGTVLGPLLFLIYINDMPEGLTPGTSLRLFADDSLLYRTISTPNDSLILQRDLDKLQQWEVSWKMEFHPQKCQVIRITHKKNIIKSNYFIHNTRLEETNTAKYLGVTIDPKMTWNAHINYVSNKANRSLGFIRRHLSSCPRHVKQQCYDTYVRPTTDYCSSVWDPSTKKNIQKVENVQRRAARFVMNNFDYRTGSVTKMLQELNWVPLEERRARNKVLLIHRAVNNNIKLPLSDLRPNVSNTRAAGVSYALPRSRTNTHMTSFFPSSIRLWNALPENKKHGSLDQLKGSLDGIIFRSRYAD